MSPVAAITRTRAATAAAAAAVVGGGALVLTGLVGANSSSSSTVAVPSPSTQRTSGTAVAVPVSTISEVESTAGEILEPECDCAPLWECMQKDAAQQKQGPGSCGLLEKELRDCMAKNANRKSK